MHLVETPALLYVIIRVWINHLNFNLKMAVKLRLQRKGRKRAPFYHIVVADARAPRDGKYIERIGSYNPMTKPATIEIDRDSAFKWLLNGAQPTDTVRAILRFKGVLYKKHLHEGVLKGALTEEQAVAKYNAWIDAKESKIASRVEQNKEERAALHKSISGTKKVVAKPVVEEVAEAPELAEEVVADVPATEDVNVASEEVADTATETVVEETVEAGDTPDNADEKVADAGEQAETEETQA